MHPQGTQHQDIVMEQLFWYLILITAVIISTLFLSFFLTPSLPLPLLAFECGMAGAIISIGMRLHYMGETYARFFSFSCKLFSIVILSGGIFALLLYPFLTSNLLFVFIFPQNAYASTFFSNQDYILQADSMKHLDNAKIILLSFVAGFLARYAPELVQFSKKTPMPKFFR